MHNLKKSLLLVVGALMTASMLQAEEVQSKKESLLPDYKQKVGFTYGVGADIVSNYIWRGLYVGGLGIQADANVGYGGLFLDMWWNLGAGDWTFKNEYGCTKMAFNPEVDMTIGFSRWGLTVMFMHMYYFDYYRNFDGSLSDRRSCYFDFSNTAPGGGITQEWRIKYRVSDKLPLSILWCTRTWGRDGYMIDGDGNRIDPSIYRDLPEDEQAKCSVKRAYSSYLELGYDFYLPYDLTLEARLGMTPWKSMYTAFQGDFAVNNASVKLIWKHSLSEHCLMTMFGNVMCNPYDLSQSITHPDTHNSVTRGRQVLFNVGCGFYLK